MLVSPGCNCVSAGEHDVVPVDGVPLEGLSRRTVVTGLGGQPDAGLDLFEYFHV